MPPPPKRSALFPPDAAVSAGQALFQQNCAFCHGRDAQGGESGPDLTQSQVVARDVGGDKIGVVVRSGRPGTPMPAFSFSGAQVAELAAFLHAERRLAQGQNGGRRGVAPSDLETGDAALGKAYFYGAGGCARCHSPSGDLAGVGARLQGLPLEMAMLYPRHAPIEVAVTTRAGQVTRGRLDYQDEFTIALRDAQGAYHSWPKKDVHYQINDPAQAHVRLLPRYTDADIHNLMAYLEGLR